MLAVRGKTTRRRPRRTAATTERLADTDAGVRGTAAEGVRELVEVLPHPEAARAALVSADAVVRSVSVYLLARAPRR
jgi:hypothetical protein